jgi:hypothetical protein
MNAPGVREETLMRYKGNGSAEMTDTSLVRLGFQLNPMTATT